MSDTIQRNWQNLADTIILMAVTDYRRALYRNSKRPYQLDTLREIFELEQFFCSAWFSKLCNINGAQLLLDIKKQMGLETR